MYLGWFYGILKVVRGNLKFEFCIRNLCDVMTLDLDLLDLCFFSLISMFLFRNMLFRWDSWIIVWSLIFDKFYIVIKLTATQSNWQEQRLQDLFEFLFFFKFFYLNSHHHNENSNLPSPKSSTVTVTTEHFATENKFNYLRKSHRISFAISADAHISHASNFHFHSPHPDLLSYF